MFGGGGGGIAPNGKPAAPAKKKATAVPGIYLYGGTGAGKTVLLDIFFRSLPEDFPVRRLHWHEFSRDGFKYMDEVGKAQKADGGPKGSQMSIFDAVAEKVTGRCKLLLLDEIFSPLDPDSKALVQAALRAACPSAVVLAIYHADSGTCVPKAGFFTDVLDFEKQADGAMRVSRIPTCD